MVYLLLLYNIPIPVSLVPVNQIFPFEFCKIFVILKTPPLLDFIVVSNLLDLILDLLKSTSKIFPSKSATKTVELIPLQIVTSLLKLLNLLIELFLKL